ncbi:MAG: glycosyltransferase [Bacteroidia bacterium]|nr:glycosyltransferase [Bacteroidia bacterium]
MLAPIVLFAYKRPKHLYHTLETLRRNALASESELYVYVDGARTEREQVAVAEVQAVVSATTGFKAVYPVFREENQGLARSVIAGVSEVLARHSLAIVMEDDMLCSADFLKFMNDGLSHYIHHPQIFSLSGFSFPLRLPKFYRENVYFVPRPSSWGWATWADRWAKADWCVSDYAQFLKDPIRQRAFNRGGRRPDAYAGQADVGPD